MNRENKILRKLYGYFFEIFLHVDKIIDCFFVVFMLKKVHGQIVAYLI